MSFTNLQSEDQLYFYLKSNKIDINDYKYTEVEGKNKFGIKDTKPLQNPYLWNGIVNKNLSEPIEFLIKYKPDWVNNKIVSAIITGNPHGDSEDCLVPRSQIVALLSILKKNDKFFNLHMEDMMIMMCQFCLKSSRVFHILLAYSKNNDVDIRPNGTFTKNILGEAAKTGSIDLVEMIVGYYPETINQCECWPFLNAMKRGLYEMAVYFVQKGLDPHCKNDLGYKLLKRNDEKKVMFFAKNKEAHDYLVRLYEGQLD